MNLIQGATKDCNRSDCNITERSGVSTLVAWTPTYDKLGNRTDRGDPNSYTSELRCSKCGQQWSVVTRFGETTITAQHPWPSPDLKASQQPKVSE